APKQTFVIAQRIFDLLCCVNPRAPRTAHSTAQCGLVDNVWRGWSKKGGGSQDYADASFLLSARRNNHSGGISSSWRAAASSLVFLFCIAPTIFLHPKK